MKTNDRSKSTGLKKAAFAKPVVAVAAALTLACGGAAAYAVAGGGARDIGEKLPVVSVHGDGPKNVKIDGLIKPNSEVMFLAACPAADTRAKITSSLGVEGVMSPAADTGQLLGYLTLLNQIGPNPAGGAHTVHITCASGGSAEVTLPNDGNGAK